MEALHQNYICKLGGSAFQQIWRRLCNKNANSGDDYIPQKKKKKKLSSELYMQTWRFCIRCSAIQQKWAVRISAPV